MKHSFIVQMVLRGSLGRILNGPWGFRGRRVRGLLVMIPMMGGECRRGKYYFAGLVEIASGLGDLTKCRRVKYYSDGLEEGRSVPCHCSHPSEKKKNNQPKA